MYIHLQCDFNHGTVSPILFWLFSRFYSWSSVSSDSITPAIKNRCNIPNYDIIKNKQKRRNFNATSLMVHIKNFLNYWYGNHSPSNITALLYTLDVEEKGILHIKSNIVSMIRACITPLTSEFRNNFVSTILFRECNVCRLFDVQYFCE